ncbi:MAG TPA: hypothetical protein VKP30_05335 [Polyangiaceae bacterium]|nr:hypothetical protein [Polyangiaceae bacterium]
MNILAMTRSSSVDRKVCDKSVSELIPSSSSEAMATSSLRSKPRSALSLMRDTRGANLVEYIIVVGLIALIAIVGFKAFGQKVSERINKQSESVGNINAEAK